MLGCHIAELSALISREGRVEANVALCDCVILKLTFQLL